MKIYKRTLIAILAVFAMSAINVAFAQDFDDIYYNPAKQNKRTATKSNGTTAGITGAGGQYATTPDYDPAGSYSFNTGMNMNEDVYNRRTPISYSSVENIDSVNGADDFAYTRRIEMFHNPDIVVGSGDDDLIEYYYDTQSNSPSVVNIYVNNDSYWPWGLSGYTYPYWSWSYRPYYYSSWWGPSWSWSWYNPWYSWSPGWYDPWYSWSWGWGPSWGWNRPHHPAPHPGGWASWRPNPSSPGASRPHAGVNVGSRPATGSTVGRPAGRPAGTGSSTVRPANAGSTISRPASAGTTTSRPANTGTTTSRPTSNPSGVTPSAPTTRGRSTVSTPSNSSPSRPAGSSGSSFRSSGGGAMQSGGSSGRGRR